MKNPPKLSLDGKATKHIEILVSKELSGQRLDQAIAQLELGMSRSQVKNLIQNTQISINGKNPKKPGLKLHENQKIIIQLLEPEKSNLTPTNLNLKIIYEDEYLAVVDKPAGISVHPSSTEKGVTLVHGLLYSLKSLSQVGGIERPGIVHRLDKGTLGVLVVSKTDAAHQKLSEQFKNHTIERKYKAFVYGDLSAKGIAGKIETYFGRHPQNRKKMTGKIRKGKKAITHWKILQNHKHLTFVECKLHTGRTHQIRVHLSELGYPIVGDRLYGNHLARANVFMKHYPLLHQILKNLEHPLLQAYYLGFIHPVTQKELKFELPLPEPFLFLQKALVSKD